MFEMKSTYLNTAYMGPTPLASKAKIVERLNLGLDPYNFESSEWFSFTDRIRERIAKLLGAAPVEIAFSTAVSELVSHVGNGLNLGPDDEIVLMEGEYPSMVLPWMVQSELRGFKIRFLPHKTFLNPSEYAKELGPKTRYSACSHVMFNTGTRMPVAELGAECRKKDILFLTDVSQSFGGMTVAPEIVKNCDIIVGVAYKWLLGPYGSAWGYFSERAIQKIPRTHASWLNSMSSVSRENLLNYSTSTYPGARRFDRGEAPSFLITAGLEGALDVLLEQGLTNIEKKNRELTDYFLSELPKSFKVAAPYELRSNIVCVQPSGTNADTVKNALATKNIVASLREGNLRFSFHFFNTKEQVDQALNVLKKI